MLKQCVHNMFTRFPFQTILSWKFMYKKKAFDQTMSDISHKSFMPMAER